MRKSSVFIAAAVSACLFGGSMIFGAGKMPVITIDGKASELSEKMLIRDNRIYIPLAAAGDALGYRVYWAEDTKTAAVETNQYPENLFSYGSEIEGVSLFALNYKNEPADGPLSNFILSVNGVNQVFKWAGQDFNRWPLMTLIHNGEHIAVVTNIAAGTGIHGQALYAVDKNTLNEIPVETLTDFFENRVAVQPDAASVTITSGADSWTIASEPLDGAAMADIIKLGIENHSYFKAMEERVTGVVLLENGDQRIGAFELDYVFDKDRYTVNKVNFTMAADAAEIYDWVYNTWTY